MLERVLVRGIQTMHIVSLPFAGNLNSPQNPHRQDRLRGEDSTAKVGVATRIFDAYRSPGEE